jgi:hypothetical protein
MHRIGPHVNERSEFRRTHQKGAADLFNEAADVINAVGGRLEGEIPHDRVVRVGALCFVPFVSVGLTKEMFSMRLHQKMTALLAASLALVLWGCNSEQVETGAEKAAEGLEKAGAATESVGSKLGKKIENAGEGTKLEGAANATGAGVEKAGEKIHDGATALGDKAKEVAPSVGKAVENASDKLKDIEHKVVDKAKDLGAKVKEEAKDLKEKAGDKIKDLKDKASDALHKDKDAAKPADPDKKD